MLALRRIAWHTFHDALERALETIQGWLATTPAATQTQGLRATRALRDAWHAGRFDQCAYAVLRALVNDPQMPSSIAARSAVEAIGAWRAELEENANQER